jgi:sodium/hydrogen antiporter
MSQLNIALLIIGGAVLLLGLFSKVLKRWGLPDPLILLVLGVMLGPQGVGLLTPETWGDPMVNLEQAARLTLAVGLMGVALRIPKTYTRDRWREIIVLLLLGMPFMWLSSSLIAGLFLGLPAWAALLIGAIMAPTDPVVASSIVTGPIAEDKLPERLRHLLSAESGINDGFAYAFVLLPILMLTRPAGEAVQHWIFMVLPWDIVGAVLVGALIGYVAGRLLWLSEEKKAIEEPSILAFTTALALSTLAAVKLMGSDGILAVFVCGIAFDQAVSRDERAQEKRVVAGVDRFFILPVFVLLGLLIPWQEWLDLGWTGVLLALAVLFLRRLPLFLALGGQLSDLRGVSDRTFAGWFGPIGVAALYYAAVASKRTEVEEVWPVVSLVVCVSIAVHGLTSTPFSRWYGRSRPR